jgi:hypothetical protein
MLAGRKPNFSAHAQRQEDRLKSCEKELVRLGHFEERTFAVRASASVVLSSIMNSREIMANPIVRLRGFNVTEGGMTIINTNEERTAVATVRTIPDHAIIVLTARQQMGKWEDLIRDAEGRQMTNRTLLIKAPHTAPELEAMLHELETRDMRY